MPTAPQIETFDHYLVVPWAEIFHNPHVKLPPAPNWPRIPPHVPHPTCTLSDPMDYKIKHFPQGGLLVLHDNEANSYGVGRLPDGLEYVAAAGGDPPPLVNGRAGQAAYQGGIAVEFTGNCSSGDTLLERNFLAVQDLFYTDPHLKGPLELVALRGRFVLYRYVTEAEASVHRLDLFTGVFE